MSITLPINTITQTCHFSAALQFHCGALAYAESKYQLLCHTDGIFLSRIKASKLEGNMLDLECGLELASCIIFFPIHQIVPHNFIP